MRISRRCFLASVATLATAAETTNRGRTFPTAAIRYLDPATESAIVRLTDPNFNAYLPLPKNRAAAKTILYASDFNGKWDAYRMDLKSGESRQLTDAAALDVSSLGFLPGERGFWHIDKGVFIESLFGRGQSLKTREIYRIAAGFEKTAEISYGDEGQYAAFVEKSAGPGTRYRLQVVRITNGQARTVVESSEEIVDVLLRPKHTSVSYRIGNRTSLVNFDGTGGRQLSLADGEIGQAQWVADGHALLYLNRPPDPKQLTGLREHDPESGVDTRVAGTSQYVHFHGNPDGSMFVGASGSKASPYVLLLSRAGKREFTLAEHRAGNASLVAPVFTANSQAILFLSDRHGKPAIYYMPVDKLVSETDGS
ncbi:MAG: hypothetical protein ABL967_09225 [Bryobacteraceae bacterium]